MSSSEKFDPQALTDFARYYGFHYAMIDPLALVQDVLIDMERGLRGQSSSLPMIPAYISPVSQVPRGKTVIALDAGGTNLRAALIRFDDQGTAQAQNTEKAPMPGTYGRVSPEQFFDKIAEVTVPLLEKEPHVEGIGFTFSYPTEITKDADGILLGFSKEVDAPEVIGKSIGQGLRDALARRKISVPQKIVLLNDTVATLLSGLLSIPPQGGMGRNQYGVAPGLAVGLILGTGINTAYPERHIPKIRFASADAPQIVVCETGTFAHRYMGILDREYDATTKNPGAYTLEKAAAGAYLGPLTFHILKQAIRDGLLRFRKSEEFLAWPTLQTKDLNAFMHAPLKGEGPIGKLFDVDEKDAIATLVYLTSLVTERAARFSAAMVAAAVERLEGYDPLAPIRIAVEGTTYMIYQGMRTALESYLHTILVSGKKRFYVISPVDQASLFGAAVAALSA
ncbi:MAG: hexokinase [Treponema sp.]|jgi:hexokinase|nr:hexokinase [Treponema sp.]